MLRWLYKPLRILGLVLIAAYFFGAAGLLVTKYVLLPKVDQWRPTIESQLSSQLGANVTIDALAISWHGLHPSADVTGLKVEFTDQPAFEVPQIHAVLSWQSLIKREPIFADLIVRGLSLTVRQQEDGQITLVGLPHTADAVSPSQSADQDQPFDSNRFMQSPAAMWLLNQGRVQLVDATLTWQDLRRQAPDLMLKNVNVSVENGLLSRRLSLRATPPSQIANPIEIGAKIGDIVGQIGSPLPGGSDGEIFLAVSQFDPQALAPWFDVPSLQGTLSFRTWLDIKNYKIKYLTVDFAGKNVTSDASISTHLSNLPPWSIGQFTARVQGSPSQMFEGFTVPDIFYENEDVGKILFKLQSRDVTVNLHDTPKTDSVIQTAFLQTALLDIAIARQGRDNIAVDINQAVVTTVDAQVSMIGNWRTSDSAPLGVADMTAQIKNLKLPNLYRYLPASTDDETFAWLSKAFLAGEIEQASMVLKGPVDQAPFTRDSRAGVFRLTGTFSGLDLNYVPGLPAHASWPIFRGVRGTLRVDQDNLTVQADWGQLIALDQPDTTQIAVQNLRVDIESLVTHPTVSVVSQTVGSAANYLHTVKSSALAEFVPQAVSNAQIDGMLEMPLTVNLALAHPDQTQFDASLVFKNNTIKLDGKPLINGLMGQVNLSNDGARITQLSAQFMGGSVTVQGQIGDAQTQVQIVGHATHEGIKALEPSPLFELLKGQFDYQVQVEQFKGSPLKVVLTSSLQGLAVNLPAPLGKTSAASVPLNVEFVQSTNLKNNLGTVNVKWGSVLSASMLASAIDGAKSSTPLFSQVNIGIGRPLDRSAKGMSVVGEFKQIDIDRWETFQTVLTQEMARPVVGRPMFPDIGVIRLASPTVLLEDRTFLDVSVALSQYSPNNWVFDLGSKDITGTIKWATAKGHITGSVLAHFPKFDMAINASQAEQTSGTNSKPPDSTASTDSFWDDVKLWQSVSDVEIRVDDLILFNNHAGSLNLKVKPQLDQKRWQIDRLNLMTPYGQLDSKGYLNVDAIGGVNLEVDVNVVDLGKLLAYVGYPDRIVRGAGTMQAKIDWAQFPWSTDPQGLNGTATVDLRDGIFAHVNSRSARMLEILSLQSLRRFFRLDINPDNTFQSGFPWRSIAGDFVMESGRVNTQNLVIESPVAEITLDGLTNIVNQSWDIKATVRPQLDLSGSALAAGFVVNPIVGLSAMVGQFLLRNPIERALSAQYHVTGSWDNPLVTSGGEVVPTDSQSPGTTNDPTTPDAPNAPTAPNPLGNETPQPNR